MKSLYEIKKILMAGVLLASVSLFPTSCREYEMEEIEEINALKEEVKDEDEGKKPITTNARVRPPHANLSEAFTGYKNSFLVSSGSFQYFRESINTSSKDYFWRQALDILMVQDVFEFADPSTANRDLITNLLNTFLEQNRGSGGLYDWNWNEYNDDLAWAGLAFARGYKITGNTTFRDQAQYAFDRAYDRGWDSQLGGGIWWDIRENAKEALSNVPNADLACYLYEFGLGEEYRQKANAIMDWTWNTIYDNGRVYQQINADGSLSTGVSVYNQGAFISAAQHLNEINGGNTSWVDDCIDVIEYTRNNQTSGGILTSSQREGTWQSEFSRGLRQFLDNHPTYWDDYYDWMKQNADRLWSNRRTDRNLIWNSWTSRTPSDNNTAVECVGGVIHLAATPATNPASGGGGIVSGATYSIIGKASGRAMDVEGGSTAQGANVLQWENNNASNQRWVVSSVGGNAYSITNVNSGMSLDLEGGGADNGANLLQWGWHGGDNQRWYLQSDGEGYYTIVSVESGRAIDVEGGSTANGGNIIQWSINGQDNQKWSFVQ